MPTGCLHQGVVVQGEKPLVSNSIVEPVVYIHTTMSEGAYHEVTYDDGDKYKGVCQDSSHPRFTLVV